MPRLVDHEVRRREITSAVRRVVVGGGLESVTFQSVAAEAGISVRLVQYYFGTKREFLLATHQSVRTDAGARLMRALSLLGPEASPREVVTTFLVEMLPLDDERREEAIVLGAFHAAALTGGGIAADETLAAPRELVALIAGQLRRVTDRDAVTPPMDPDLDAELILAAAGGIAQGMLPGYGTAEQAVQLVERLLDRVLGPESPGTTA
ncbi:TetR/AcrR family transcriptional regulator [Rhodococcus tukisamuensis]|uniref:DNA-binding transcriptional regulator, AcrR family n=1 Tax=Rhodococcus tukisamuensis TaxID=168276 RepID=A0A1G6UL61_9NOCA|nr:TetR/AcrR family transcriptional regulator [Rhodococcus tukisamuensis]SDD41466.1 DNA-binding transcriptional regulator, AcrR family [Rhodococcus tukisamuensis]